MFRVCHAFLSVHCSLVVTCWEMVILLAVLYVMFYCVCHFPMWCPWAGVVLDCINCIFASLLTLVLCPFLGHRQTVQTPRSAASDQCLHCLLTECSILNKNE